MKEVEETFQDRFEQLMADFSKVGKDLTNFLPKSRSVRRKFNSWGRLDNAFADAWKRSEQHIGEVLFLYVAAALTAALFDSTCSQVRG